MSGVAWRNMIEKRLPLEARRRWAHKKFDLDSVFVEVVRRCTKAEESFKEQLALENPTITHEKTDGDVEKEIRILLSRKTNQNQPGIKPEQTTRQRKKDYMQKKGIRQQKGKTKEKWNIPIGMRPTKILIQKLDNNEAEQVSAQDAAWPTIRGDTVAGML